MRWRKLGLIYCPDEGKPWAVSHAMIPTPIRLSPDVVRVFITVCDAEGVGRPSYVDLSAYDLRKVLRVSPQPLLDIGKPGTFDEAGLLACSAIHLGDCRMAMYYVGFEIGSKIRYRMLTGLAYSEDGGETFTRWSETPLLERTPAELYFRCGPCCLREKHLFRLWYVAGSQWTQIGDKLLPVYDIRYMESTDGKSWPKSGEVQISITSEDEHGFGRPWVIKTDEGRYGMFYSIRRRSLSSYRLGYAESEDGRSWQRLDETLNLDVDPASGAFDSEAIMYLATLQIEGRIYGFYNGNEFGKDGFAVAVLEEK